MTAAQRSSDEAARKLVVLLGEEPSHLWREAEHGEVAAGDEAGAQVNRRRFVVEGDFQVRRVVGGEHARQRRLARAELLIDRIEQDESLAATLWLEQDEPIGVGYGQRAQHHGVEDAERGGRRADPDRQRDDRNRRERWIAAEHPCRISEVLQERFDRGKATLIAVGLLHLIDAAERASRGGLRIAG